MPGYLAGQSNEFDAETVKHPVEGKFPQSSLNLFVCCLCVVAIGINPPSTIDHNLPARLHQDVAAPPQEFPRLTWQIALRHPAFDRLPPFQHGKVLNLCLKEIIHCHEDYEAVWGAADSKTWPMLQQPLQLLGAALQPGFDLVPSSGQAKPHSSHATAGCFAPRW